MVRFIHAADLRLGLVHRFFDEAARARYLQARFEALASIGQLAATEAAAFVVVAGDVFATNHVRPRTVLRACEALAVMPVETTLAAERATWLDESVDSDLPMPTRTRRRSLVS